MHKYITDHAFVRYIERVHGVQVEAIKDEMLRYGLKEAVDGGARKVRIEGLDFIISPDRKVKTVMGDDLSFANRRQKDLLRQKQLENVND